MTDPLDHRAEAARLLAAVAPVAKGGASLWDLQVLAAKAQTHALLYVGDQVAALRASQQVRRAYDWGPEPAWTPNDVVRHCVRGEREYFALLQRPDPNAEGWWHATVLKVERAAEPTVIVGQGVRLLEGGENNQVMRFPSRG